MRNLCFRRYTLAALLVGAVGVPSCNLVFSETDGLDGNVRIGQPFINPIPTGISGGDPSLTFDETELWAVGGSPYDLQVAKPTGAAPPWSYQPAAVALLNTVPTNEIEPALTKDGLLLAFVSNRAGPDQLYFATRTATNLPFQNPTPNSVTLPNSFLGFDMSPNGNKIYIVDNGMLRVMKRTSPTGEFVFDKMISVPDTNFRYPSVSFDELEIIYSDIDAATVMHATLAAGGMRYENPTVLAVGETCSLLEDADLSADAMTVVYNCSGSLHIARRQ